MPSEAARDRANHDTNNRPLLLVDVDGVLNPWEATDTPDGYHEYDFFPGERVLLSPDHGQLLRDLSKDFDLVWATAWEHRANRLICPVLSIPELPVIEFPLAAPYFAVNKLPAVIQAVGDRPCAWIDDMHGVDHFDWADRRAAPTLILAIDPAIGFTADVAVRLAAWAQSLSAEDHG